MRKITKEACDAMMGGRSYKNSNTSVIDGAMYLHGNKIAKVLPHGIMVTTAGWDTNTTMERLNGIPGVRVNIKKGQLYLNGAEWDGKWRLL